MAEDYGRNLWSTNWCMMGIHGGAWSLYPYENILAASRAMKESCWGLIYHALILTLLLNLTLIYLNVSRNSMLLSQVKTYLSSFRLTIFWYSYCVKNLRLLTYYFFLTFVVLNCIQNFKVPVATHGLLVEFKICSKISVHLSIRQSNSCFFYFLSCWGAMITSL
jgi:hypothetical protein